MEMQAFHCNSRNALKHKVIVCTYTQITYTYQIDYMHYKLSYLYNVIMHCGNYTEGQIHVTHAWQNRSHLKEISLLAVILTPLVSPSSLLNEIVSRTFPLEVRAFTWEFFFSNSSSRNSTVCFDLSLTLVACSVESYCPSLLPLAKPSNSLIT